LFLNCFGRNFAQKYANKVEGQKSQVTKAEVRCPRHKPDTKMAIIITDECINCGACEPECPNTAIYEGADDWRYKDGTTLRGKVVLPSGETVDADEPRKPVSDDIYYIVPGKCTECKGFHEEPQCAAVCPVDCCVPDPDHVESEETLLNRQSFLHNE
jgi:ferredoxin